jgi:2-keto-3-deoxy-L-rhamnonate aldolase RhmA
MAKVVNAARRRLDAGEIAIGVGLRQARTVDIGKIMKACGYDWLFIDLEHGSMTLEMAAQLSVAAQDAGVTPIVRVPEFDRYMATRALDSGALGVVFPHVDTPEQAAQIVDFCRYPPIGHRSVVGSLPQTGFESMPLAEATAMINAETMVIVMLETPQAIENADAIAAVPGVDCLLVGTNDLTMELGIPGDVGNPMLVPIYEQVVAACRAHGKYPALGGVYTADLIERYVGLGMRAILAGTDLSFMMAAARERANVIRQLAID